MGFLGDLAQGAVNLAPYAEQVVARHDQRALANLARQRQAKLDDQNDQLFQAKIDAAHHPQVPVRYIRGSTGEYIAVPARMDLSGSAANSSAPGSAPADIAASSMDGFDPRMPSSALRNGASAPNSPMGTANTLTMQPGQLVGGTDRQRAMAGYAAQQQTQSAGQVPPIAVRRPGALPLTTGPKQPGASPLSIGVPTGIQAPPGRQAAPPQPHQTTMQVGNRTARGHVDASGLFSPDTTASGDTVFAPSTAQRTLRPRQTTGLIGGRNVRGTVDDANLFTPDTTAQGDTLFARSPAARPASAGDGGLNHNINNVRSQIADTERQIAQLQPTLKAGGDRFATPQQKAAAVAAVQQAQTLSKRRDSLSAVHDQLVSRQQQQGGFGSPSSGAAADDSTSSAPAHNTGRLSPQDAKAMQDEFNQSAEDLQRLMTSSAPDNVKQQARKLYQQHQVEIAAKYGVMPRPGGGNE